MKSHPSAFQQSLQLVSKASPQQEWIYLVNETLAGERSIVPLLEGVRKTSGMTIAFRTMIDRQIAEEVDHVERYTKLFGERNYRSSGYDDDLVAFVSDLDSPTLRLFALQAILESISLGALRYRQLAFPTSPSSHDDDVVLRDEEGHIVFGHAFFSELLARDGILPEKNFQAVTRAMNKIFSNHFSGVKIAYFFARNFGDRTVKANEVEASVAMRQFRRLSAKTVVEVKNGFLERYRSKANGAKNPKVLVGQHATS